MSKIITLRNAVVNDAADMAVLDNIASFGLSLWFWQGAVNCGMAGDAYEWGRQRMASDDEMFGYSNAVIAEVDNAIAGVAVGNMVNIKAALPDKSVNPVFAPIFDLFTQCDGVWYLDSIAIYTSFRRLGVGNKLLDECFKRAKNCGAKNICLIAEDENEPAISFYASRGFVEKDRRKYVAFNEENKSDNWLLLSAVL